ncbi:MAG: ADP-ribosylglycohydrolase family protein, partial [Planctomycetota bacterium]
GGYGNEFDGAIQDDDINYTVLGHFIVDRHDHSFTPLKVAHTWMSQLPMLMTCTAERVAYRNFSNAILPPLSASYRNPCREWIGAQIRGDYFGYANPGDPERAADMAFRDACVSHVKNGIYGEMWVAAMLAAAFTCRTLDEVIDAGLAQIPERCRLRAALDHVRRLHADGASFEQVRDDIRGRWDELDHHDWCHTISNAEITLAGLLWGGDDFGAVVCNSVMCGLDTDCTAATAASVWGVLHGVGAVPGKWAGPLDNRGRSHLQIRPNFKIDELAADMAETARRTGARLDA